MAQSPDREPDSGATTIDEAGASRWPQWLRRSIRNPTYVDRAAVAIDTRSLAAFRIGLACLIFGDLIARSRNFHFFYTEDGVVPQSMAESMTADNAFSVFFYTTDTTAIAGLFVLQAIVAGLLLVGYRTRLSTILAFVLVVSLDHHNPLVLSYADTLFRLLLFWAIFLPLGDRWSIDAAHARRSPRTAVASLASAAILIQIVYMYFVNGYHKRESDLWTSGEATPLIMGLDNTTFLFGEFTRNFPTLLQYGGLGWYYMLLFSPLLILLRGKARLALLLAFVGGHASFALTVRIGAFPYVALTGLVLFVQTPIWDRATRAIASRSARPAPATRSLQQFARAIPNPRLLGGYVERTRSGLLTIAVAIAVVSLLVLPALSLAPVAGFVDDEGGPKERADEHATTFRIAQPDWSVFAPHPRTVDRYYVFAAETETGDRIDVYHDRPLTADRPEGSLQAQFGTYRERFYMNSVRRGGPNDVVPETLAEHLCETWEGDQGESLTHVNMYYVVEQVTLETLDDHDERASEVRSIYAHGCGDNEPTQISLEDG